MSSERPDVSIEQLKRSFQLRPSGVVQLSVQNSGVGVIIVVSLASALSFENGYL